MSELTTNIPDNDLDLKLSSDKPEEEEDVWNSIVHSGFKSLKCIYSLNSLKSKSALKCADEIMKYVREVLNVSYSYDKEVNSDSRSSGIVSVGLDAVALQETAMERLRQYQFNFSLENILGTAKDTARAGLSWFKPGKKTLFFKLVEITTEKFLVNYKCKYI